MISAIRKTQEKTPLLKMFQTGKLGKGMDAIVRLQAVAEFYADYRRSLQTPRMTVVYDGMPRTRSYGSNDGRLLGAQEACDRCNAALRALGKYRFYAEHFLINGENVRQFILKYPVLCADSVPTYTAVYAAIRTALDILAAHYQSVRENSAG